MSTGNTGTNERMAVDRVASTLERLRNRVLEAAASCAGAPGRHELLWNTGWTRLRQGYGGQADEALANTGWTDEARAASLAVRQAKAAARRAERDKMFAEQKKRTGKKFVGNWYPRGNDGWSKDPHIGESNKKAPYGYVDGTRTPRKEPLYDDEGRAIVPRPWEHFFKPKTGFWPFTKDESFETDSEWLERLDAAEALWGRFGRKKKFMDSHPGATEQDWEKYDREQYEKWKAGNQ